MPMALIPHPDSGCEAVVHIEVEVVRSNTRALMLRYVVTGTIEDLRLPGAAMPVRTDGLWQHTCFETFIRPVGGEAYYEFNLAPSTEWAAYSFTSYRSGMRALDLSPPHIETRSTADTYELRTKLALDHLPADTAWHINLAAVIEEANGRKSYWALGHPPGKADFHHPDCFVHQLPAAERAQ